MIIYSQESVFITLRSKNSSSGVTSISSVNFLNIVYPHLQKLYTILHEPLMDY